MTKKIAKGVQRIDSVKPEVCGLSKKPFSNQSATESANYRTDDSRYNYSDWSEWTSNFYSSNSTEKCTAEGAPK